MRLRVVILASLVAACGEAGSFEFPERLPEQPNVDNEEGTASAAEEPGPREDVPMLTPIEVCTEVCEALRSCITDPECVPECLESPFTGSPACLDVYRTYGLCFATYCPRQPPSLEACLSPREIETVELCARF